MPGRTQLKPRWYHFLKLYKPMVKDGTHAVIEISRAKFFKEDLPKEVVCSAFANDELYFAIANYSLKPATVALTVDVEDLESGEKTRVVEMAPQALRILRKT